MTSDDSTDLMPSERIAANIRPFHCPLDLGDGNFDSLCESEQVNRTLRSPDFSPIEQAFSKLKTALRRTGARTREELDVAITAGLRTITADDSQGWFAHCGYPIPAHLL